jgi:hypothetical protein
VIDGHGVSSDVARDDYVRRILAEVEAGRGVSQRSLARSAGIALGLTNLVLRNLVRKGWVRITRVKANRVKYERVFRVHYAFLRGSAGPGTRALRRALRRLASGTVT